MNIHTNVISVRTLLNRVDELWVNDNEKPEELTVLQAIADKLRGRSNDVQWRGNWYPDYLVADHYFTEYVKETLIGCGTIPANLPEWVEIDWDSTAKNLKVDYAPIDIDGDTYWYLRGIRPYGVSWRGRIPRYRL